MTKEVERDQITGTKYCNVGRLNLEFYNKVGQLEPTTIPILQNK